MTTLELIDNAGGVVTVAAKLGYSIHTVAYWRYRVRLVPTRGNVRTQLCRLAGVRADEVDWVTTTKGGMKP